MKFDEVGVVESVSVSLNSVGMSGHPHTHTYVPRLKKMQESGQDCGLNEYNYLLKAAVDFGAAFGIAFLSN